MNKFIFFSNEKAKRDKKSENKPATMINIVDELGELWEEDGYEAEYKVNEFLEKLK